MSARRERGFTLLELLIAMTLIEFELARTLGRHAVTESDRVIREPNPDRSVIIEAVMRTSHNVKVAILARLCCLKRPQL